MIIRSKEFKEGIPVMDESGKELGVSQTVGKKAVLQTTATRCVMPLLPLGLPTVSFFLLDKLGMIPKAKGPKLAQQLVVFTYSIMFAPAMSWAFFPQVCKISSSTLEPEFQNLKDASGNTITELYYNKGL